MFIDNTEGADLSHPMRLRLIRRGMPLLVVLLIVLATVPAFFSAYRGAAFDTEPTDDYAPYLLAMTGVTGEQLHRQSELFPGAPMAHRALAVAVALPAYYALPFYAFSQLEEVDEPYLRATAALAFVGWLSMLLTALAVYAIARRKLRCSQVASYIAALLTFLLFSFVRLPGVDSLAVLLIAMLVYFFDRPAIFVPLVLASVVINEKVVIVAVVLTGARLLSWVISQRSAQGFRYGPQLVASVVALAAYVLFRQVVLPRSAGAYEGQLDPTTWPAKMLETIDLSLSLKGLITGGIPITVITILVIIAWVMAPRLRTGTTSFERSDVVVAPALLVTGAFIGMEFTVGRLVLHSFPVYLPMIAVLVDLYVRSHAITRPPPELIPTGE